MAAPWSSSEGEAQPGTRKRSAGVALRRIGTGLLTDIAAFGAVMLRLLLWFVPPEMIHAEWERQRCVAPRAA